MSLPSEKKKLTQGRALMARYKVLAEMIVRERKARNLMQKDICERLQIPQPWLARIEQGKGRLGVLHFLEIAHAIGFDPHKVLREIERD
jgi:transcriptional regulator with XRE-family HTH domain